jgi:hypothetical protein
VKVKRDFGDKKRFLLPVFDETNSTAHQPAHKRVLLKQQQTFREILPNPRNLCG